MLFIYFYFFGSKTSREKSNDREKTNKEKSNSEENKEKPAKELQVGDGDKPDATTVRENGKSEGKSKKSDKKTKEEKMAKLKVKREKQEHSDERRAEKEKIKRGLSKDQEKADDWGSTSRDRAEERSSTAVSSSNLTSQKQSEDSLQKYVDERGKQLITA